jgi:putative ABC transport system substrate-binding protein
MRRRDLLVGGVAVAAAMAAVLPGAAAAGRRVYRLGFMTTTSAPAERHQALVESLSNLGYREGHELVIERRYAAGDLDRLPALAADLVRANVDVIVTETTPAALAAKQATTSIPIVMATGGDAIGSGLVQSLARPGGNVTGMSFMGTDLMGKKIELLRELKPNAQRIGYFGNAKITPERLSFRELQSLAGAIGIEAEFFDAPAPEAFAPTFARMASATMEGVIVAESSAFTEARSRIVELAARYRLPTCYGRREFTDAGGLVSYGTSFVDLFRRAATFVDKIFKGASPGDLPVQQPTKFELVINLGAAKALGLSVPRSLLALADEVIE